MMVTPDQVMEKGIELALKGKEPESFEDWCRLVYYWHKTIAQGLQPSVLTLLCHMYNAHRLMTDKVIECISQSN